MTKAEHKAQILRAHFGRDWEKLMLIPAFLRLLHSKSTVAECKKSGAEMLAWSRAVTDPAERKRAPRVGEGGQPGNRNAAVPEPANQALYVRCRSADKAAWVKAAQAATKAGLLDPDPRGNLAAWVVRVLNDSAEQILKRRP